MRNSTSFFLTGAPSLKFTSTICPSTRAFSATVEYASTLPIAASRTTTVSCATFATVTGTAGGPLAALRPSLARMSMLKYEATRAARSLPTSEEMANTPARMTSNTAPMSRRRPEEVMGGDGSRKRRLSSRNLLAGKQFLERFAAPHQVRRGTLDQHLRGAGPGVVIRAHRHAIGAGREDGEQVALARREPPLLGEEVGALADRSDDVVNSGCAALRRAHRANLMPSAVERRPQEVVHRGVDDQEIARRAGLHVFHARDEHAGVADDRAPRVEDQLLRPGAERGERAAHERADRLRRLAFLVADADAAADVDGPQPHAGLGQTIDQRAEPRGRRDERRRVGEQRADVAADADQLELRHAGGTQIE